MNRKRGIWRAEGRGDANVIPQSALASRKPPGPGLRKGPQPCCALLSPSEPQLGRPLTRCSLLCPRALLYLPHRNQDIPSSPVSSSTSACQSPSQRPSPSLLRAVFPAASAPSPGPSLPPRCRPHAHCPMHSASHK